MIGWILEDILFEVVCYWIGYVFLKVVTLGRFPDKEEIDRRKGRIKFVGLMVIILGVATIGLFLA